MLVKISSPRGQVKERDILRGLRWLIDTYRRFNVRVVNLSVGGDDVQQPIPIIRCIGRCAG